MLGTIGFIAAALAFTMYGYSSFKLAINDKYDRINYLIGYLLTATACLVWGISIQLTNDLLTPVLIGDALLFVATGFLFNTLIPHKFTLAYSVVASILLFGGLYLRSITTSVDPVIRDGVLVFNTPRAFGAVLAIILLAVWVKANMNFYEKVVSPKFPQILRASYFSMNVLGFVSVTAFLLARKNITIILAFVLLVTSFVFLTALNYYVATVGHRKELQHAR